MDQNSVQKESAETLEVTWALALRIWASWLWRMLLGGLIGFVAAIIFGVLAKMAGGNPGIVGVVVWVIVWFLMSFVTLKKVLSLKYHDFKIVLIVRR